MLKSWADKPTPRAELLERTQAGIFLNKRVIKHAQNGSLLDIDYPRSSLLLPIPFSLPPPPWLRSSSLGVAVPCVDTSRTMAERF